MVAVAVITGRPLLKRLHSEPRLLQLPKLASLVLAKCGLILVSLEQQPRRTRDERDEGRGAARRGESSGNVWRAAVCRSTLGSAGNTRLRICAAGWRVISGLRLEARGEACRRRLLIS